MLGEKPSGKYLIISTSIRIYAKTIINRMNKQKMSNTFSLVKGFFRANKSDNRNMKYMMTQKMGVMIKIRTFSSLREKIAYKSKGSIAKAEQMMLIKSSLLCRKSRMILALVRFILLFEMARYRSSIVTPKACASGSINSVEG